MARTLLLLALALGGLQATQTAPPSKPPDAKPPATQTPAATRPGSIDLTVTGQSGLVLGDATVRAEGPASRQGTTGPDGRVVLSNLPAGTYRVRIERDTYITLEKEIAVKAASKATAEAVLSSAPPPPPPPPAPVAPPAPKAPVLVPGQPVVTSLTDQLADDLFKSKDAIAEHGLGCSGATSARLIRVRDSLPSQAHADADEVIYLLAGDATLSLNGADTAIGPGWFGLVPRGTNRTLTRRGTKALLLLSVQSGPACPASSMAIAK